MSAPQRPTCGKMKPNFAAVLAMRKSQASAMTAPAPTAMPLTAATTGRRQRADVADERAGHAREREQALHVAREELADDRR